MSTLVALILVVAGLAVLVAGADALVLGAAQIARRAGLSAFAVGVTIVAFGTSAPELFACVGSAIQDEPGIAAGNVVGSNIANIALILGIGALAGPIAIGRRIRTTEIPIMVAITGVAVIMMLNALVSRTEGVLLVAALGGYLLYIVRAHKEDILHEADEFTGKLKPAWMDALFVVGGVVGLAVGARLLVLGARDLAIGLGVDEGIVGTTIIAFGTSIPELVTTLRAIKNRADMAVGNIVGSNIFNILSVLGVTALVRPLVIESEMDRHIWIMLAVSVLFMLWALARPRLGRVAGLVFLLGYTAYIVISYTPAMGGG